ncbi:hypothetical protein Bbelb_420250 [Branchiostoma belcheri]|nr:hypothetical protein Bbelb_420250 [Branchiostoma belcheri]
MRVYRSLLPPKCTKEHLRENSDEHNMTTKRSHRPPCVSTTHCSHRSVPKNTSITPPSMRVYRSLLPPKCTKEHLRENSDEHDMHDVNAEVLVVLPKVSAKTKCRHSALRLAAIAVEPVAVRSADVVELGAECPADVVAVEELAVEARTASLLVAVHVVVVHLSSGVYFCMSSVGSFVVTITE